MQTVQSNSLLKSCHIIIINSYLSTLINFTLPTESIRVIITYGYFLWKSF
nr:MAG TPA: hypothetical protein [Caudoviricetes sp.]